MELFNSLKNKTKLFDTPFKHYELNEPLTNEAIQEICKTEIIDPKKENLDSSKVRVNSNQMLQRNSFVKSVHRYQKSIMTNIEHGSLTAIKRSAKGKQKSMA